MSAADSYRRTLIAGGIAAYGAVFGAFMLFEQPGLGLGHFFYVAIVLIALATNAWWGALAGALATCLYALGVVLAARFPSSDVITIAAGIRLVTYVGVGVVVGIFAQTNRSLVARLREQAERDFLTDLLNTRAFDELLAARCQRGGEFLLLLGDMDNLKDINDVHGHDEGNRALRRVAELLYENIGGGDDLARIGGDEFAILTGTSADDVGTLAQRLRRALAREGYEISFGWAAAPREGTVPIELFRKADDRLYAAKLLRRNHKTILRLATQDAVTGKRKPGIRSRGFRVAPNPEAASARAAAGPGLEPRPTRLPPRARARAPRPARRAAAGAGSQARRARPRRRLPRRPRRPG